MKLHSVDGQLAMPQAHDLLFGGLRGDLQTIWDGVTLDNQRVVAGRRERIRQVGEDTVVVMLNRRGLAVHEPIGPGRCRRQTHGQLH